MFLNFFLIKKSTVEVQLNEILHIKICKTKKMAWNIIQKEILME